MRILSFSQMEMIRQQKENEKRREEAEKDKIVEASQARLNELVFDFSWG